MSDAFARRGECVPKKLGSNWSARFPLAHGRAIDGVSVRCHVLDLQGNHITAAQLAVGRD
jgi:hypothetical protein